MEKASETKFDQTAYGPALFKAYKVFKKVAKYSFYIALLYFAAKGFMAWE